MNISIICPLYNAEKYIESLHLSLLNQQKVNIESIVYILTESNDSTEKIMRSLNLSYEKISKEQFSHSLIREKYALKSKGEIIVFITQDIIIKDKFWLYNLTRDIESGKCEAAFSRQICKCEGMESYIRPKNYPSKSRIVCKDDIKNYGLMTFFFSDASSAINRKVFQKLNGYDNKDLIISEDMYIAYKLIMNDFKIKYCSDSIVIHSHKFTLNQLFKRYFDTGVFFTDNNYFNNYSANKSGFSLAKYVALHCLKEGDFKTFFNLGPNFAVRFIGMKFGKNYKKIPVNFVNKFTLNKPYWQRNM